MMKKSCHASRHNNAPDVGQLDQGRALKKHELCFAQFWAGFGGRELCAFKCSMPAEREQAMDLSLSAREHPLNLFLWSWFLCAMHMSACEEQAKNR